MPRERNTTILIFHRAQELRHTQTEFEVKLWRSLRWLRMQQVGAHFRRQHAIGSYIVDFCAPTKKLIIELDGSQHLDAQEYDTERTAYLQSKGYRVLRFWNSDISSHLDEVMKVILDVLEGAEE